MASAAWRPLVGTLALSVRVLPHRIDVVVSRTPEPQTPLTLGLFMQASLDLSAKDGSTANSLSCTTAAVAWQCLDDVAEGNTSTTISLPQPEWRGQYVVMAVANSCSSLAASESFEAGPPATATSPRLHVLDVPHGSAERHFGVLWWPAALDRPCLEFSKLTCPELEVRVTNRGEDAHASDALLLLPVSSAMATPVRGQHGTWRDLLRKYSARQAAASNVLGSTRQNVTLHTTSPIHRTTYVAVLLSGAPDAADPVVAVSQIFVAGRNTPVHETRGGIFRNMSVDAEVRSDRPRRRQPLALAPASTQNDSSTAWTDVRVSLAGTGSDYVVEAKALSVDAAVRFLTFVHFTSLDTLDILANKLTHRGESTSLYTTLTEAYKSVRPAIEAGVVSFIDVATLCQFVYNTYVFRSTFMFSSKMDAATTITLRDEHPSAGLLPVQTEGLTSVFAIIDGRRQTKHAWPGMLSALFYTAPRAAACAAPSLPPSPPLPLPPLSPLPPSPPPPSSPSPPSPPPPSSPPPPPSSPSMPLPRSSSLLPSTTPPAQPLEAHASAIASQTTLGDEEGQPSPVAVTWYASALTLVALCTFTSAWYYRCRRRGCLRAPLSSARATQLMPTMMSTAPVPSPLASDEPTVPALSMHIAATSQAAVADDACDVPHIQPTEIAVCSLIGRGGYGSVFLGQWLETAVAVKVMEADGGVHMVEAQLLQKLRHPCICTFFGTTLIDGRFAMVMEYLEGGSLESLLGHTRARGRGMEAAMICRMASEVAAGLAFLHRNGIIHRDVKAANVRARVPSPPPHLVLCLSSCGTLTGVCYRYCWTASPMPRCAS